MSYSFNARGATRALAIAAAKAEFDKVVAQQPHHAQDEAAVLGAVNGIVGLLQDDPKQDVVITVSGYISWNWKRDEKPGSVPLTIASVNVAASLNERLPVEEEVGNPNRPDAGPANAEQQQPPQP